MFLFTDNSDEYFQWYANRTDGHSFDANAPTVGIAFYKSYYPLNMEPVENLLKGLKQGVSMWSHAMVPLTSPIDGFLNHSADTKVDVVISFLYRGNHFDIDELNASYQW